MSKQHAISWQNLSHQLIASRLVAGEMFAGNEIQLRVDQVLMQDALSTLTMQALEAMEIEKIAVALACQYVDHNLLQPIFGIMTTICFYKVVAQN